MLDFPASPRVPYWTAPEIDYALQQLKRLDRINTIMATLEELQTQVESLSQNETIQTGKIDGLQGAVGDLISLVGSLRTDLSPDQQAIVDSTMTTVADTLTSSAAQSSELEALAQQARDAAQGTPPEPEPTP